MCMHVCVCVCGWVGGWIKVVDMDFGKLVV